jgi:aminopeptidase YwaD
MYDCPAEIASVVHRVVASRQDLAEGEPWYQGDHGLYLINQIPALALTSEALAELMGGITHTSRDTPEIIDRARLVGVAEALADLLLHLNELSEDEGQDQP